MRNIAQQDPELEVNRITFNFSVGSATGLQYGADSQRFGMASVSIGLLPGVENVEEVNAKIASMRPQLRVTFDHYMSLDEAAKTATRIRSVIDQILELKLDQ